MYNILQGSTNHLIHDVFDICTYIRNYTCICLYKCIYIYISTYIFIFTYIYIYTHIYIYTYFYIYTYIYIYIYTYIYSYIYTCIDTYLYLYTQHNQTYGDTSKLSNHMPQEIFFKNADFMRISVMRTDQNPPSAKAGWK